MEKDLSESDWEKIIWFITSSHFFLAQWWFTKLIIFCENSVKLSSFNFRSERSRRGYTLCLSRCRTHRRQRRVPMGATCLLSVGAFRFIPSRINVLLATLLVEDFWRSPIDQDDRRPPRPNSEFGATQGPMWKTRQIRQGDLPHEQYLRHRLLRLRHLELHQHRWTDVLHQPLPWRSLLDLRHRRFILGRYRSRIKDWSSCWGLSKAGKVYLLQIW